MNLKIHKKNLFKSHESPIHPGKASSRNAAHAWVQQMTNKSTAIDFISLPWFKNGLKLLGWSLHCAINSIKAFCVHFLRHGSFS